MQKRLSKFRHQEKIETEKVVIFSKLQPALLLVVVSANSWDAVTAQMGDNSPCDLESILFINIYVYK